MTPDDAGDAGKGGATTAIGWRAALRRDVAVLLLLKALALALLWWLFFSPAHRAAADPVTTGRHMGLGAPAHAPATGGDPGHTGEQR